MRISVYITSYNQKEYLKEAIESILIQTLKPFEILIVDDCSSDGSQKLIKSYANQHDVIKYIFHEKNQGVTQVRINALKNITGDFVTYVDGDDIYLPHKLETESKLIDGGNFNLSFTNNMYVDPDDINEIKWIWATKKNQFPKAGNMYINTLARDFPNGNLFRMELVNYNLLKKVGFHDPNLKIYEDYDLRIRLAKEAKINYSLEPTTKIRISKAGLSKSISNIHYDSLQYIFDKYQKQIEELPSLEKQYVQNKMTNLIRSVIPGAERNECSSKTTTKDKLKNRLVHFIQRI